MMLYDTYQEGCRQIIEVIKTTKDQVQKAVAHIQLEQLKVKYYSGLLEDTTHPIKKLIDFNTEQLENSLWLLGNARDKYFEITGEEYVA